MNRRDVVRTLGTGAVLGSMATVAFGSTPKCANAATAATEPDPALSAIERHREARRIFDSFKDEGEGYHEADEAEWLAWQAVTETVPTTPAGIAALASHVERRVSSTDGLLYDDAARAMITIATGAAAIAAAERRGA